MKIPFHKPTITDDEIDEVVDSLRSGWITMGPKTVKFEEAFTKYIGIKHSIAVNSCTAALHLALEAVHLKAGDEVIIPTMTFTATGEAVTYFNAKPVLVDIERDTHNIDVEKIERCITPNTKALIPVHFAGQPCDMEEIFEIATKYNLFVIEDAAHSLPAWYMGKGENIETGHSNDKEISEAAEGRERDNGRKEKGGKIGTFGDITCFSFYATKTLATGEGGMVTTENDEWADRIRMQRLHGISKDAWKRYSKKGSWHYDVMDAGYKYNMTDLQAALGLAQLRKIERMWERRRLIAMRYTEAFKNMEEIIPPFVKEDRVSAWHLYIIKLNLEALKIDRAAFIEELGKRDIGTSVHFIPLHKHPFYRNKYNCKVYDFPVAEWIYERSISLPVYPEMTDAEVERVIEMVVDVVVKNRRECKVISATV
jgi:dTDP-4-amino-4,6-dideoxygalactose transaminase